MTTLTYRNSFSYHVPYVNVNVTNAVVYERIRDSTNTLDWPSYKKLPLWQKPIRHYTDLTRHYDETPVVPRRQTKDSDPLYETWSAWYTNQLTDAQSFVETTAGYSLGDCVSEARLLNEAKISALNAAADIHVNIPVAIAEGRKTVNQIYDTAQRIEKAYRAFRKGRYKAVARYLHLSPKTVHKTWLEYKYGWTPLLMDVKGSVEAFAQSQFGRPITFTVAKRASSGVKTSDWSNPNSYGFAGSGKCLDSGHSESHREVRVKMIFEVVNPLLSTAQQLGITNPATVAWELVPFSFVFDWFIHVGDYLNALTALHGLQVKWSMSSTLEESSGFRTWADPTFVSSGIRNHAFTNTRKFSRRWYRRDPLIVDVLELYPPVSHGDFFGVNKLISGLSLLRATHHL